MQARGATQLAVSPEHPGFSGPLRDKLGLAFPVLVDEGSRIASRYGLLYDLPADLCTLYRSFTIDLERFNTSGRWELPMPATFVIDSSGIIRYAVVNVDYTCRPEPEAALVVLAGCRDDG